MTPKERALLIGSPVGELNGTDNDVNTMLDVLRSRGFEVGNDAFVRRLVGQDATRQNILDEWENLISVTSHNDIVVIYYSGHGGLVESKGGHDDQDHPWRIQFIVPYDFDLGLQNVTYILDCCHSARLGRKVGASQPKTLVLPKSPHSTLTKIMQQLRQEGRLEENQLQTNPHVVRIAAAAADETAWECDLDGHGSVGLLTKNLATAIRDAGHNTSWRDIMLEVSTLVQSDYPEGQQHPRSAGPDSRTPFSTDTRPTGALLATISNEGYTILRGGLVNGLQEGDMFEIIPFNSHAHQISTGVSPIAQIYGFAAILSPTPKSSDFGSTKESLMGMAFLRKRHSRWPVSMPRNLKHASARLGKSIFLRPCEDGEIPRFKIRPKDDRLVLYSDQGLQFASESLVSLDTQHAVGNLFEDAERFVQGQNLVSLKTGCDEESLGQKVEIEVGMEVDGKKEALVCRSELSSGNMVQNAPLNLTENDRLYIGLRNDSMSKVCINVFSVDAAGKIALVSKAWEKGVDLPPGRGIVLSSQRLPLRGIPVRWPQSVPRQEFLEESFVFVITSQEIDLRDLDASFTGHVSRGTDQAAERDGGIIPYDVERVRYHLRPF